MREANAHLLEVTDGKMSLISARSVAPAHPLTVTAHATKPRAIENLPAPKQIRRDVERELLKPKHFRSANEINADMPDRFGLYAIRARGLDVIPELHRSAAENASPP